MHRYFLLVIVFGVHAIFYRIETNITGVNNIDYLGKGVRGDGISSILKSVKVLHFQYRLKNHLKR